MDKSNPQDIASICILRLSAIGDVTHVLPVIHTLRKQAPQARITWVIGKLEHQLLGGLPDVEFIVFDKSAGRAAYAQLRDDLRDRHFDVLLQMQVAARANLASLLIKADRRIGYDRARSKDLHGWVVNERIRPAPTQHVLDSLGSFLQPLGIQQEEIHWQLPLDEADYRFARESIDPALQTLVIAPVSSHQRRNWLADRYAAVADHAVKRHDMQVILSGGPSAFEREFGDAIKVAMTEQATDLIGKDTLKQSAALLGSADLVLCPDTGPLHIANAMGTAVIGLHAASNPRRSGAYRALEWSVDRYDDAARQFRGKPAQRLKWGTKLEYPDVMKLITVDDVVRKLDAWVAAQG